MGMVTAAFRQQGFRGRDDDVALNSSTFTHALNTNWTQIVDTPFRVRFLVEETAGGLENVTWAVYYSHNGGAYAEVTTSTPVKVVDCTNFADDAGTTSVMTGTGTFLAGYGSDVDARMPNAGNQSWSGNQYTELEQCLSIDSAQVSHNDTISLRIYKSTGTTITYNQTPTITVDANSITINRTTAFAATGSVTTSAALTVAETTTFTATGALSTSARLKGTTAFAASGSMSTAAQRCVTLEGLDSYGDLDSLSDSLDSSVWCTTVLAPASTTFTGTGSLSTSATLGSGGTTIQRATAFSGTGSLATSAKFTETTTFAASGLLATTAKFKADTAFAATGSLASTARFKATTAFSGTGSLSTTASVSIPATTAFAATGALSTSATLTIAASTTFTGAGTLSTTGTVAGGTISRTTGFSASASLTSNARFKATSSFGSTASVNALAQLKGVTGFAASGVFVSSALFRATTNFSGAGTLATTATGGGEVVTDDLEPLYWSPPWPIVRDVTEKLGTIRKRSRGVRP